MIEKRLITVPVGEIIPYDNNPRKNDKAVKAVAESIEQTGYNNPIVVDENFVVLAGHTRLKSLKKLGREEIEVLQVSGMSDEQKKKYRLLDNKAGEYATWDYVALVEEIAGLDWGNLEMDWGLFDSEEEPDDAAPIEKEKTPSHKCPECGFEW